MINCYYASEIDKYACQISRRNWPDIEQIGDVKKVDGKDYRGVDLLLGGSPCQGFSYAGRQLNFDDPRSALFFEFVRIKEECRPRYFLFENVPMNQEIENVISDLLGVQPIKINSGLVSAQNRKRSYWTNIPGIRQPKDRGIMLESVVHPDALVDRDKAHAIIASVGRTTTREYFLKNQGQLVYRSVMLSNVYGGFKEGKPRVHVGKSVTLRTPAGGGHIPSLVINGKTKDFSLDELKDVTRKVTPEECERLQTLPEGYTRGVSDTQRYKATGNGWTVDVISHILSGIPHSAHSLAQPSALQQRAKISKLDDFYEVA